MSDWANFGGGDKQASGKVREQAIAYYVQSTCIVQVHVVGIFAELHERQVRDVGITVVDR